MDILDSLTLLQNADILVRIFNYSMRIISCFLKSARYVFSITLQSAKVIRARENALHVKVN